MHSFLGNDKFHGRLTYYTSFSFQQLCPDSVSVASVVNGSMSVASMVINSEKRNTKSKARQRYAASVAKDIQQTCSQKGFLPQDILKLVVKHPWAEFSDCHEIKIENVNIFRDTAKSLAFLASAQSRVHHHYKLGQHPTTHEFKIVWSSCHLWQFLQSAIKGSSKPFGRQQLRRTVNSSRFFASKTLLWISPGVPSLHWNHFMCTMQQTRTWSCAAARSTCIYEGRCKLWSNVYKNKISHSQRLTTSPCLSCFTKIVHVKNIHTFLGHASPTRLSCVITWNRSGKMWRLLLLLLMRRWQLSSLSSKKSKLMVQMESCWRTSKETRYNA